MVLELDFRFPVKRWTVCFLCFCLLGCQVKPGERKVPLPDKEVISQSVNGIYTPAVDILFIIDESSSMNKYQRRLMRNADSFIEYFSKGNLIDYHIGVTTSSTNPNLPSVKSRMDGIFYISRTTSNGSQLLFDMMDVGTGGDISEKFLNIPELTFEHNGGFLRSEAHLAIFVITDTDDQSNVFPQRAYQYLLDLKGGDEKKLHYAAALVFKDGIDCSFDPIGGRKGPPYTLMRMVDLFGDRGYSFDLCESDYGKELAKVARSILHSILTIDLDDLPDVTSIRICYREVTFREREFCETGQEILNGSDGWVYDIERNVIHLSPNIVLNNRLDGSFDVQYIPVYSPEER